MQQPPFHRQFAPSVQRVIDRLYGETIRHDGEIRATALRQGYANDGQEGFYHAMASAKMPVTPDFGAMLYILARSTAARQIVEFGTSFGVSTLFLACALRDSGGGAVVTTEFVPEKAHSAGANLREAGLDDLVEIRVGDARDTLSGDDDQPIDLILLDAAKELYLDVLKLLEPRLRSGGVVVSDRADLEGNDGGRAAAYLAYLREPANGYRISTISTEAVGQRFLHDIAVRA